MQHKPTQSSQRIQPSTTVTDKGVERLARTQDCYRQRVCLSCASGGFSSRHGGVPWKLLSTLGLVALVIGAVLLIWLPPAEEAPGGRSGGPPPVITENAEVTQLDEIVESLGTLRADESVVLASKVTERIEAIYFEDGQHIEEGQRLIQLYDDEVEAELTEARTALDEARRQLERIQSVAGTGAVSKSDIDVEQTRFDAAQARVNIYEARLRDRLITAPFAGILGLRNVSPGKMVSSNEPLVTLHAIDPLKVDFTVPERYAATLKEGLEVEGRSVAFPDTVFTGMIQSINPVADPVTRAFVARALIPNKSNALRPGMLLNIRLYMGQTEAILISESALSPVGDRHYVFIVDESDNAQRREVTVGKRFPGKVEILDGLAPGDEVITHGYRARPGQKVARTTKDNVFTAADPAQGPI